MIRDGIEVLLGAASSLHCTTGRVNRWSLSSLDFIDVAACTSAATAVSRPETPLTARTHRLWSRQHGWSAIGYVPTDSS